MPLLKSSLSLCCLWLFPACALAQDAAAFEQQQLPGLVKTYKQVHAHPELSHFEANTSALVADELRKSGYTVTDHIGVYPDRSKAYGVVGILRNGPGPTLLIRADMDALPIIEETGVPYASHVRMKDKAGQEVGVMEACGHDIHTTVLIGTARTLAASRSAWHSAGTVGITSGAAMASSTSVDVIIRGIGGHGAYPFAGRDPIVLSAEYITQIQTIVSREEDPRDPAVVTVGSIHGGTKRNIIRDEVKLELTTRAFSDKGRQVILDGLKQMALGIGTSAGLPPEKMPTVTVDDAESTPVTFNDPAMTARVKATLVSTLGAANVFDDPPAMGSEDVGIFGLAAKAPTVYFWLGAMYPDRFAAAAAAGKLLPGMHTSKFEPDPEPTLATGVKSLTAVAISLLK
jgi:hippurate hydrolase